MKRLYWQKNSSQQRRWFIGLVIVPLLLIAIYIILIAQPRFMSTSSVIIKQQTEQTSSFLGGLGAFFGGSSTNTEDAKLLQTYIQSADMLSYLDKTLALRKLFSGKAFDPLFNMSKTASAEDFLTYYRKRVHVFLDDKTSMLTVEAEAFTPEQAQLLNKTILEQSELFINDISHQLARQHLLYAEQQLADATKRLNIAKEDVLHFQNSNNVLDPKANAEAISQLIAGLQTKLAEQQTIERTQLSYLNADAPQMIALHSQITSLEQQISSEKAKLTSSSSTHLNRQAMQFESIKAAAEYSADLYKLSLNALEKARVESLHNVKKLVVIEHAQLPQDAIFPQTGYILLTSLILLSMFFGLVQLIISVIKDHQE